MLENSGFRAWISIGGSETKTHGVQVSQNGKQVSCWIASEAGKNFSVNWTDASPSRPYATSGEVTVDGISCGGRITLPYAPQRSQSKAEVRTSATTSRPFVFSVLRLTDDDSYLNSTSEHLGDISLGIWRVEVGLPHAVKTVNAVPEAEQIHERSKKALVHHITFGDSVHHAARPAIQAFRLDKEALTTFIFKYRSIDILRANGIVPAPDPIQHPTLSCQPRVSEKRKAPPSPGPSHRVKSEDINQEDDSEAEEARAMATLAAIRAKRAKKGNTKQVRVKAEDRGPRTFVQGEIIDLT